MHNESFRFIVVLEGIHDWLGGVERDGTVAVHRSYLRSNGAKVNFSAIESILGASYTNIIEFLEEIRAPKIVQSEIMQTSSKALVLLGTVAKNELKYDPVLEEYLDSRCFGIVSIAESDLEYELYAKRPRTTLEEQAYKLLKQRVRANYKCRSHAHVEAVFEAIK